MRKAQGNSIRRNSIIWVDLGARKGHIQSGCRPCIVVSCNKANKHAPVYTVIPGTTQYEKADFPVHFMLEPDDVEDHLACLFHAFERDIFHLSMEVVTACKDVRTWQTHE